MSKLTLKLKRALLTAYALGYYDVPRRISSEQL
ncbi:MAG: helix-turn-helix domain-containing protein [Nitrososphaeraceae archaeon]